MRLAGWSWGAGPVVLLVHGWQGTAAQMAPVASALARSGYRAVMFDLPAHGSSAGRTTNIPECARALHTVVAAVGACDGIVAHSFGATTAMYAMATGLHTRALALLAPARGPSSFVHAYANRIGLPPDRVSGMIRHLEQRVGMRLSDLDAVGLARACDVPTLVLHDRNDDHVPWDQGAAIAAALRRATLVEANGLGHGGMLADADSIAIISDFVRWHTQRDA